MLGTFLSRQAKEEKYILQGHFFGSRCVPYEGLDLSITVTEGTSLFRGHSSTPECVPNEGSILRSLISSVT